MATTRGAARRGHGASPRAAPCAPPRARAAAARMAPSAAHGPGVAAVAGRGARRSCSVRRDRGVAPQPSVGSATPVSRGACAAARPGALDGEPARRLASAGARNDGVLVNEFSSRPRNQRTPTSRLHCGRRRWYAVIQAMRLVEEDVLPRRKDFTPSSLLSHRGARSAATLASHESGHRGKPPRVVRRRRRGPAP